LQEAKLQKCSFGGTAGFNEVQLKISFIKFTCCFRETEIRSIVVSSVDEIRISALSNKLPEMIAER
jgi:hypothetical protein